MGKLELDLGALRVESFAPSAEWANAGEERDRPGGALGSFTYDKSCYYSCLGCTRDC